MKNLLPIFYFLTCTIAFISCEKKIESPVKNPDNSLKISDAITTVDLRVLQLNVWQEGTMVNDGLDKIANVIIQVKPDVATFSEVRNYSGDWITKLRKNLASKGYHYKGSFINGTDVGIISKYPITSNVKLNSVAAHAIDVNGRKVIVCAAHLDYTQYALYLPRGYNGGTPNWDMIDNNADGNPDPVTDINTILHYNHASQRDEAINDFLKWAKQKTTPIIFAGDFNEASYLDWTSSSKNLYDHNGVVAEWQNCKKLASKEYIDSYRQAHPNSVTHPGITWPSYADGVSPTNWLTKSDERDRIDFIFFKGQGLYTKSASIVGPNKSWVKNQLVTENTSDIFLAFDLPWPSDHKGLLSVIALP